MNRLTSPVRASVRREMTTAYRAAGPSDGRSAGTKMWL